MRAHMAGNPGTAAKENIWGGMEWNGGGGGGREDGYQAQPCAHQHGVVKHIRVAVGTPRMRMRMRVSALAFACM